MAPVPWPLADDEDGRIATLRALGILERPRSSDLDGLARLAAHVCGVPHAVVNVLDVDQQRQIAAHGIVPGDASRADSMCARNIRSHDVAYTPDAATDARWQDSAFVDGRIAEVRLYASAPMVTRDGHVLGTMCAFDTTPGELDRVQLELLRDIAHQAVRLFELYAEVDDLGTAATRDALTGLPNRVLLQEGLARRTGQAVDAPIAVVFIDLDRFKTVNDTLGHDAGDELLRIAASRLTAAVRAEDLVARLGGDEFVVLGHVDHPSDLAELVDRLRAELEGDAAIGNEIVALSASIGAVLADRPDETDGELLARADAAMYADKRRRHAGRAA